MWKNCLNFSQFKDERYQQNAHMKKFQTPEVSTRKTLGPTKYPQERISDPWNTHKKNSEPTKAQWPDSTRPTRLKMTQDPQNLALSVW